LTCPGAPGCCFFFSFFFFYAVAVVVLHYPVIGAQERLAFEGVLQGGHRVRHAVFVAAPRRVKAARARRTPRAPPRRTAAFAYPGRAAMPLPRRRRNMEIVPVRQRPAAQGRQRFRSSFSSAPLLSPNRKDPKVLGLIEYPECSSSQRLHPLGYAVIVVAYEWVSLRRYLEASYGDVPGR
jgi:hypothetical protein